PRAVPPLAAGNRASRPDRLCRDRTGGAGTSGAAGGGHGLHDEFPRLGRPRPGRDSATAPGLGVALADRHPCRPAPDAQGAGVPVAPEGLGEGVEILRLSLAGLSQPARGHLAMLAFSALVAGSFSLGVLAAPEIDPGALSVVRFILAGVLVGAAAVATTGIPRSAWVAPWRY